MKFKYLAKNYSGQSVRGVVEAASAAAAAELIKEQKLVPVSVNKIGDGLSLSSLNAALGYVSTGDLANFTRQLSTMVTAGLPLTDALNLLRVQSSAALVPVVTSILTDVQSGISLSTAMAKFPKVFSKVYIALVKSGEAAGILEKILMRLADNAEKSKEFRTKVIGAMIYPIIIVLGMIGVFILMIVVVIPKLSALYDDFGAELPAATKFLMNTSDFVLSYWWIIIAAFVGLSFLMRSWMSTETGKYQMAEMVAKAPVFGPLSQKVMLTELTRTLSLLINAGVSVVEALNIVSGVVSSVVIQKEVKNIASRVEKGFPISISFSESSAFPPLMGQMMAVGEETGKMDEVLAKISKYYEAEAEEKIKGLTTAIEPIILIVLAVGVGFLMYAIITPIYTITDKI